MTEVERKRAGWPADMPAEVQFPDGIRRDRERTSESLAFIKQHPVWYAGVMLGRMWGMLKVAGDPVPYTGISGINVTGKKCLPEHWQGGAIAFGVNVLGSLQSVARYLFLPLAAFGIYVGLRRDWPLSFLMLVTVLYYLVPGAAAHTEIRYVLPMHGILTVFSSVGIVYLVRKIRG
jgi:hypothetical protein